MSKKLLEVMNDNNTSGITKFETYWNHLKKMFLGLAFIMLFFNFTLYQNPTEEIMLLIIYFFGSLGVYYLGLELMGLVQQ